MQACPKAASLSDTRMTILLGMHTLESSPHHETWMNLALKEAREAGESGDVPVGAVVVHLQDSPLVIATARNQREALNDPTAHAEVLALREAAEQLGSWRLNECLLVVTLEPCPMCAGALWASRIGGVIQGAVNFDAGCLGTLYHLGQDPRLNHEFPLRAGVLEQECSELLATYFQQRR